MKKIYKGDKLVEVQLSKSEQLELIKKNLLLLGEQSTRSLGAQTSGKKRVPK